MRKKLVEIADGEKYTIGALNVDQVESIVSPLDEATASTGVARVYEIVAMGLNNPIEDAAEKAGEKVDESKLWTTAKVRKEFDLVSLPIIKDAVLSFSNLKQEVPAEGEATAAQ